MPPSSTRETVAVVGAGATGLATAWLLARGNYTVHLYEAQPRPGGHAHTIDIPIPGASPPASIPVDTGFIVYNTQTYPDLISLFQLLAVDEENSSMSFASSVHLPSGHFLEWGSDSLNTVFADRSNLYRPNMYTMIYDIQRFNTAVYEFVHAASDPAYSQRNISLDQFLQRGAYSPVFIRAYLIPMVSAVWSASYNSALQFPARSLFHFFVNHGLAQVFSRPQWRTPAKRSRDYVTRLLANFRANGGTLHLSTAVTHVERHSDSVTVHAKGTDPVCFDHIVFATHAPTTLRILGDSASDDERRILSSFQYSTNKEYVHHDPALMPTNRAVWSSWNFIGRRPPAQTSAQSSSTPNQQQPSLTPESSMNQPTQQPSPTNLPMQSPDESTPSTSPDIPNALEPVSEGVSNAANQPVASATDPPPVATEDEAPVCVSYWLNRLQNFHKYHVPVPDLFITLNPVIPIDPSKIIAELSYDHPQFTEAAISAQTQVQSVLQGQHRTWFCGAWTRFGFHEDAIMSGLDIAERLSDNTIIRPWKAKNCLAINNNARPYEMPYSQLRAPLIVFLSALLVLNAVMSRLQAGLGKIATRMTDNDPVVVVAGGDGRLHRFGPRHVHRRTSSFFTFSRLSELSSTAELPQPIAARITVRSPKVLARIADALRQGDELAPIAAAAFAASELDCPSPTDLSETLRALFIAGTLDDPSTARRGRAKLAENLLFAVVGNFDEVKSMPLNTRLPELTTCMSSVISPSWWLELDDENGAGVENPSTGSRLMSKVSPRDLREATSVLELLGDLSEFTVALLQKNPACRATIVVPTEERIQFVSRKADLLSVREQVSVLLMDEFRVQRSSGFGSSHDLDADETLYDIILSPGIVNSYATCGFKSTSELMSLLKSLISVQGVVELGAVVYGRQRKMAQDKNGRRKDSMFCGDRGYVVPETTEVLRLADSHGFDLEQVCMMDEEEAAMDVYEVIQRVFNSLATEKLEANETRRVLAQMCLWQAALGVKYVRRIAFSLTLI